MTLTIAPSEVNEDDVIVAVDGHEVTPVHVIEVVPGTNGHVRVEQPFNAVYSPDRYLDKFGTIEVKRGDEPEPLPEPEPVKPAKPKRTRKATRTIDGIKWISQGNQVWRSEDGRWEVAYDDSFEYDCDDEHPMRFTRNMRWEGGGLARRYGLRIGDIKFFDGGQVNPLYGMPSNAIYALIEGKPGYLCPGNESHFYGQWVAGAVSGEPQVIIREDNFEHACHAVATHIETGEIWA